jgi:hypothetical protein
MKHLLLSLALILSANAWADDDVYLFDLFAKSYGSSLECSEDLKSYESKEDGYFACKKFLGQGIYQVIFVARYGALKNSPVSTVTIEKKGLCFGPRGQLKQNEDYCSRQKDWVENKKPYLSELAITNEIKEEEPAEYLKTIGKILGGIINVGLGVALVAAELESGQSSSTTPVYKKVRDCKYSGTDSSGNPSSKGRYVCKEKKVRAN